MLTTCNEGGWRPSTTACCDNTGRSPRVGLKCGVRSDVIVRATPGDLTILDPSDHLPIDANVEEVYLRFGVVLMYLLCCS